jgi:post-segregation antitoxin (ccd killing protein)
MVRLQIQLDAAQHRQVKKRAKQLGVSVSAVIRRAVAAELRQTDADDRHARLRRALAVAGKYAEPGGSAQTAANHDAALAEAFKT